MVPVPGSQSLDFSHSGYPKLQTGRLRQKSFNYSSAMKHLDCNDDRETNYSKNDQRDSKLYPDTIPSHN